MPQVPRTRTPVTPQQAEELLRQAWVQEHGSEPRPSVLRNVLALWDLETAAGRSQYQHNWGNIVAISENQQYYMADDSGNLRRFRTWPTAAAGARGLVHQLTKPNRAHWARGLLTGSPEEFAEALAEPPAYYEADPVTYGRVLRQRYDKYPHLVDRPQPARPRPSVPRTVPKRRPAPRRRGTTTPRGSVLPVLLLAGLGIVVLAATVDS
ncbi:MAG: glucosaminidase domain-containing protein [Actinomycetia bacterium]|nr:glucosaminidase domain-containing protein [Actinomycetes bacterium]